MARLKRGAVRSLERLKTLCPDQNHTIWVVAGKDVYRGSVFKISKTGRVLFNLNKVVDGVPEENVISHTTSVEDLGFNDSEEMFVQRTKNRLHIFALREQAERYNIEGK